VAAAVDEAVLTIETLIGELLEKKELAHEKIVEGS
jgi:hypothetical protein